MKRSDYKYVYNTLPKFGNSPFEKQTWFIKDGPTANECAVEIREWVIPALQSGKPVFCTYYDTINKQLKYLTRIWTDGQTQGVYFEELEFPTHVTIDRNAPAIVTCVVF